MSRRHEEPRGIVDAHDLVARRVEDKQRLLQMANALGQHMALHIVQKLPFDGELAPGKRDPGTPFLPDRGEIRREVLHHMFRVRRCANCRDRNGLGNIMGRRQDRRPAQRMAYEDPRCLVVRAQEVRCLHEIRDVGREIGRCEVTARPAQAREIEPQHRDARPGQSLGDAPCRRHILGAGETMGKERIGTRFTGGNVEPCRKFRAIMPGEVQPDRLRHFSLPRMRLAVSAQSARPAVRPSSSRHKMET